MKILKHGTIHKFKCPDCECEFLMNKSEEAAACMSYILNWVGGSYVDTYVPSPNKYRCPECGSMQAQKIKEVPKDGKNRGTEAISEPD